MKPSQLTVDEMQDACWYPCTPFIRWVLLALGLVSIGFGMRELVLGNGFQAFSWITGLWMLWNARRPPVLKRKSWVERHIMRLLLGLIAAVALCLLLFAAHTWWIAAE